MDCIFCKILTGSIPAKKIAEDDKAFIIADIAPQAETHWLVIPKRHIASLKDLSNTDRNELLPAMYALAEKTANEKGFSSHGYRAVINNQSAAGQTVFHLHMHVLSGEKLGHFGA